MCHENTRNPKSISKCRDDEQPEKNKQIIHNIPKVPQSSIKMSRRGLEKNDWTQSVAGSEIEGGR